MLTCYAYYYRSITYLYIIQFLGLSNKSRCHDSQKSLKPLNKTKQTKQTPNHRLVWRAHTSWCDKLRLWGGAWQVDSPKRRYPTLYADNLNWCNLSRWASSFFFSRVFQFFRVFFSTLMSTTCPFLLFVLVCCLLSCISVPCIFNLKGFGLEESLRPPPRVSSLSSPQGSSAPLSSPRFVDNSLVLKASALSGAPSSKGGLVVAPLRVGSLQSGASWLG